MSFLICVLVWASILYLIVWMLVRADKWHDRKDHQQLAKIMNTPIRVTRQKERK